MVNKKSFGQIYSSPDRTLNNGNQIHGMKKILQNSLSSTIWPAQYQDLSMQESYGCGIEILPHVMQHSIPLPRQTYSYHWFTHHQPSETAQQLSGTPAWQSWRRPPRHSTAWTYPRRSQVSSSRPEGGARFRSEAGGMFSQTPVE